jgi:ABC-type antimicrobial peptide transport system permease subunit
MDVAPTYFQFMNLPVARGRTFFAGEGNVSVVSESLARTIWPNEDPVGKTLERRGVARIVVGVVKDSGLGLLNPGTNEAYAPIANLSNATLFVHTLGDLRALTRNLRAAVSVPGTTPSIAPIHGVLGISTDSQAGTLFGVLGVIATALAFIGILGLVAFAVAQRTREIGVRLAIGAQSSDILRTVIGQYAIALSMGALAGVALAAASAQILQGKLFGLPPIDLPSYAIGLGLFGAVALVAILLPARRALGINPASALRSE